VAAVRKSLGDQVMKLQPKLQGASRPVLLKLEQCWKTAAAAQGEFLKRHPRDELLKVGLAVVLLFTGGRFPLTIASVQCFRMACWQRVKKAFQELQDSYFSACGQRNLQDPSLSADIMRVVKAMLSAKSASEREEAMRSSLNVVKCIDPYKTRDVLSSVWPGVVAVLATLQSRFAFAACVGANVGDMLFETIRKGHFLELTLMQRSSEGFAEVGLQQVCTAFSFCLSLYTARVMTALNTALQGSSTLSKALFQYIVGQKSLPESSRSTIGKCVLPLLGSRPELGKEEEMVKWSIAMIGFYLQVRRHQQYPLPVRIPLAPLYLVEYCLTRLTSG